MKKKIYLLKKIIVLFFTLFIFLGCEQLKFTNLFNGVSKKDIINAIQIMNKKEILSFIRIPEKNWHIINIATCNYIQFENKKIDGTEKVRAIFSEANNERDRIFVIARKDKNLENVIQLYYIPNVSIDGRNIYFTSHYCEAFLLVNLKNKTAVYGDNYLYPKNILESVNNIDWINGIIKQEKLEYLII